MGGWWLLRRHLVPLSVFGSIARVLASAVVMGLAVYLIRSWPLALVVAIGAGVYGLALVLLRALTSEEWSIVRSGLTSRSP